MSLQIANPSVVDKVERLARVTGLTKTAAVEQAVEKMLHEMGGTADTAQRLGALLQQIDRIADRHDVSDPLQWDDRGLPL